MILDRSTENIREIVWSDINAVLNEIADYYLRKFENPYNIREGLLRQFEGAVTNELSGINLEDYIRTNNCSLELVAKYNKLLKIKSDFYGGLINYNSYYNKPAEKIEVKDEPKEEVTTNVLEEKNDCVGEDLTNYVEEIINNTEIVTDTEEEKEENNNNFVNEESNEEKEQDLTNYVEEIINNVETTDTNESCDVVLDNKENNAVEHKPANIEGYIKVLDEAIKERDKKEVVHATIDPNATIEEIEEDYSAISELLGDEDIVIKFKESE